MLPARYDPFFSPFHVLKRDMERTFGDFFRDLGMTPTPDLEDTFEPRLDLVETDEGYKLRADLPGVDPRDVKVNLVGNTLTIEGEKREEKEEGERTSATYFRERRWSRFQRSLTLPETIDASKIKATVRHGVLELTVPKSEQARPRAIEVQVAGEIEAPTPVKGVEKKVEDKTKVEDKKKAA